MRRYAKGGSMEKAKADEIRTGAVERMGKIEDLDRGFDIAYWQRQGPKAIFAAAHEMVVDAHRIKGIPLDDTIRRDVERYGKTPW
jgi:hypothetical protein